eukprot:GHVT01100519.1.p2 GENE.GHVT01100519.1~~GHVT01100519.1.p2  ORF type:complete len:169 (+),score=18.20 GHVT01100519.1:940-1446(+)
MPSHDATKPVAFGPRRHVDVRSSQQTGRVKALAQGKVLRRLDMEPAKLRLVRPHSEEPTQMRPLQESSICHGKPIRALGKPKVFKSADSSREDSNKGDGFCCVERAGQSRHANFCSHQLQLMLFFRKLQIKQIRPRVQRFAKPKHLFHHIQVARGAPAAPRQSSRVTK